MSDTQYAIPLLQKTLLYRVSTTERVVLEIGVTLPLSVSRHMRVSNDGTELESVALSRPRKVVQPVASEPRS
jgi:hypothetical protein